MNFETKFELINNFTVEQDLRVMIFDEDETMKDFDLTQLGQFEMAHSLQGGFLCKLELTLDHTVYGSRQAVEEFSLDEIKAVLLHEKGHAHHNHLIAMKINGEAGISSVLEREFEADEFALANGASKEVLISALEKCFERSNRWLKSQHHVWKTHTPGFKGFFRRLEVVGRIDINLKKRIKNIRNFK